MSILLVGILLGVIVIPVVQGLGRRAGCLHGSLPGRGSFRVRPRQPQPTDSTPSTPVSQVIWTPEVLEILARADVAKGRAKVQEVCVVVTAKPAFQPRQNFRTWLVNPGPRFTSSCSTIGPAVVRNPLMTDVAKALRELEIADVAAYYAGQPQRNPNPVTLAPAPPEIVQLVELGDPRRNIPPCASCHRPGSGGPIEGPRF